MPRAIPLDDRFLTVPITHRGLHGVDGTGRVVPENSMAAAQAAIDAGYAIECDIQPGPDGVPLVFHDYQLQRLTGQPGFISAIDAGALAALRLLGTNEPVPTLARFLDLVAGQVPLLIEIKDQDGACGPDVGALPARVAQDLQGYAGPVAVMSFNPHMIAAFRTDAPDIPVGLTTCAFPEGDWTRVPPERRDALAAIADFDDLGASFISHDKADLTNPRVDALRAGGTPVLCWTIRTPEEEAAARRIAQNITFEGYAAAL
ncbi:glycerophosphodiester phosphodiesterase family protein [Paracoccus nototheniae]|uniref:Glycerophosphodiester phosphodiesterase family protein n=1 Tax=Paracoccus nototheniae TaxID=2489002 RepID=A0ABW4DX08_9RHOB|nr:glycerophosphodiester phosphodiesterase family protein [Paracoccus nototheniae]